MGGERNAPHSRHPVRQPELVRIFRVGVLGLPARMRVTVYEPRQHIHPGGVNFVVGVLWLTILTLRQTGRAGAANIADPVVLDDDVNRSLGRRASSINQNGAADDQCLEWPPALARGPVRRGVDRWRRFLRLRADQNDGERGDQSYFWHIVPPDRVKAGVSVSVALRKYIPFVLNK